MGKIEGRLRRMSMLFLGTTLFSSLGIAGTAAQTGPNPQGWPLDLIHAQAAYNRGFTGAGVTVAVGDSGFDINHPALAGAWNLSRAVNFIGVGNNPYNPNDVSPQLPYVDAKGVVRYDKHGTHVAGIIAARNVAGQMHGVAYDASLVPIRTILSNPYYGYTDAIADAGAAPISYFDGLNGVMVYNASYGPNIPPKPALQVWGLNTMMSGATYNAVLGALSAGKIIVAATGNDYGFHPDAANNPSGLALYPYVQPAHAHTNVYDDQGLGLDYSALGNQPGQIIGVMAITADKQATYYSNRCGVTASWCVAAPGGDNAQQQFYSTVPYSSYDYLSGTSMAAPTVSGTLAVLIQANPTYNAQDLSHLLFSTTEDLGLPGIDTVFGQGLIRLDRATDGPTTLAANATETVAAGSTTYWSQLLQTQGDVTKAGDGILTISGRTNAGGNVFAQLGTLSVDGTLSMTVGNLLSIARPATLAGFGTINGNTQIAGTLSPGKMANLQDLIGNNAITAGIVTAGNSAGTLTFNGNVTLTSTATTRIDIDGIAGVAGGPGTYDRIYVTGAGNVFYAAGTLTPILRGSIGTPSGFTAQIGTEVPFVQAFYGARTAGTFSTLVQPTQGLADNARFDLIYLPTSITLAVTPSSFTNLADTDALDANAQHVGRLLDSHRTDPGVVPSAPEKALYDALYQLDSEAKVEKALSQLSGPGQPAVASASLQAFAGFLGAIGDRQDIVGFGGDAGQNGAAQSFALSYAGRNMLTAETSAALNAFASIGPGERAQDGWAIWGQGFGRTSRVGDSGDLAGSKATSAGFTLGADRRFSNTLMAGAAFGYAHTSATSIDTQGVSDTYGGALYASWTPGAAVVDVRIAGGPSAMSSSRQIVLSSSSLQGSTNGIGLGTAVEAGYRFSLTPDLVLKPFGGLSWQGFRRDGYSESQQPIGLAYATRAYDKLTSIAGAALSARLRTTDGTTFIPELKLAWGHDLRDTTLTSQAALLDDAFLVSAAAPGRNAALVSAKVSGWRSESLSVFAAYNGEYRSNATSHQLSAGARFTW
ncbi:autotransporter domain-containing protein [Rhodopseudomonas boonkerdii]|uniref:autotransporter domain-containing protein n=1 Tax=Rhodopseudomonas boonkerdii TaxID=475937 RepID=UPI001E643BF8|nr:autotransporter domain-containing protein [Rhodopseudomonas boonkerdii]